MTTTYYKETTTQVRFSDIKNHEMFYHNGIFWTKHHGAVDGRTGATALVGFMTEDGSRSKLFEEDEAVFTITVEIRD